MFPSGWQYHAVKGTAGKNLPGCSPRGLRVQHEANSYYDAAIAGSEAVIGFPFTAIIDSSHIAYGKAIGFTYGKKLSPSEVINFRQMQQFSGDRLSEATWSGKIPFCLFSSDFMASTTSGRRQNRS